MRRCEASRPVPAARRAGRWPPLRAEGTHITCSILRVHHRKGEEPHLHQPFVLLLRAALRSLPWSRRSPALHSRRGSSFRFPRTGAAISSASELAVLSRAAAGALLLRDTRLFGIS